MGKSLMLSPEFQTWSADTASGIHIVPKNHDTNRGNMAVCQNPGTPVVGIYLKMVLIGIDPYPYGEIVILMSQNGPKRAYLGMDLASLDLDGPTSPPAAVHCFRISSPIGEIPRFRW